MERVHYRRVAEPGGRLRTAPDSPEGVSDYRERLIMQGVVCAVILAVVLAVRLVDGDLTSRLRVNLRQALSEQVSAQNLTANFEKIKDTLLGRYINGEEVPPVVSENTGEAGGEAVIPDEALVPSEALVPAYNAEADFYIDEDVLAEFDDPKYTVPEQPASLEP